MNKIYKLVWSKVRNAWVVASEIAKGHGKNASAARERKLLKTAVITAIMGGCLMTGGLASAALTAEQQAVYDAVMAKLEERGGNHYVSVNPLKKEQTADSNYENNGAKGDGGIAIGEDATSQGRGIAMGYKSKAVPKTGATANLNAFEGIAIGQEADMEVPGGIAIGLRSKVEGTLNTKDGEVNVNELGTIALGTDSYAKGNGAAAFGWKAKGNGEGAMAFGTETKAKESGTAFGGHADAAAGGVAVGWQAHAHDLWAMSIGTSSDAKGKYSTALGGATTAEAVGSTAVGFATVSKGVLSTAVGAQSVAEEPGSVALGADSVANTKAGKIGYIATGSSVTFEDALKTLNKKEDYDKWTAKVNESKAEYDNLTKAFEDAPTKDKKAEAKAALDAWKGQHADFIEALTKKEKLEATWRATKAAVSVGADGVDKAGNRIIESRQITNVAAGTRDTDAVNVAQLKALDTKVEGNKIHYLSIGPDNEKNLAQDGNYNNDGADSHWGIAIGVNASSKGGGSIAIGKGSQAHGTEEHRAQGVSIGSASRAIGAFATAVGHDTKAFGERSVAYGLGDAYGQGSIAIGSGAVAALKEGITKEEYNKLSDEEKAWYGKADYDAQKIFYQFRHKGKDGKVEDIKNYGMAIGSGAKSFDNAGLAVGFNAKTNKDFGVALGGYAENKVEQGVALGTSSVADRAKDVKGYLPTTGKAIENFEEAMKATGKETAFKELKVKYLAAQEKLTKAQEAYKADQSPTNMMNLDKAQKELKGLTEEYAVMTAPWTSRRGAVSVGNDKTGFTRQIIGVAAGSEDTDAVNVAQLKALNTKVDKGAIHYYSVTSDKKAAGSNFDNDGAKGTDSMVIGIGSSSEAENSTVLGNNNTLKRYNADQNGSSSRNNIVVGQNMEVEGAHNAVFGTDYQNNLENRKTMVAGKHNTVIGVGNLAGYTAEKDPQNRFKWIYSKVENGSDSGNVVVGMNNTATRGSLVIGSESEATSSGISVGNHNKVVSDEDFGVALGSDLVVDGYQALAIGSKSEAKADYTVAIGGGALAEKENSIAFGNEAKAQNNYSVAIGSFAKATARSGVALGSSSLADREKGAIGYLAGEETSEVWKATQGAVSVGNKEKKYTRQITGVAAGTEDTDAVNVAQLKALNTKVDKGAIHYFSVKSDDSANPAGTNWNNDGATGQDAVAIGKNAAASGKSAFATGWKSKAAGYSDIAIGREAEATGGWGVAIGQSAKAQASTAVAMAYAAEAKGANSLAIGVQSEAKTNDSTAYGREAKALGDVALAVGAKTKAEGNHSSVFGYEATTDSTAWNGTAIGRGAYIGKQAADGTTPDVGVSNNYYTPVDDDTAVEAGKETMNSTAVGFGAKSFGYQNTALGAGAEAFDTNTVAVGVMSKAIGHYANALGKQARAEGKDSIAIGHFARAIGESSTVLGDYAITSTLDGKKGVSKSVAVGSHARAASDNSIALGNNSLANIADNVKTEAYLSKETFKKENGVVSVGNKEYTVGNEKIEQNYRRITNVAGGADDHDAVNVAQLKALDKKVTDKLKDAGGVHYFSVVSDPADETTSDGTNWKNDGAKGVGSMAIGRKASTDGEWNTAVGFDANAKGEKTTAIGVKSSANGEEALAVGVFAKAEGLHATAIGAQSNAKGIASTAFGQYSKAEGLGATAFGFRSKVTSEGGLALGPNSVVTAKFGTAIGLGANAMQEEGVALGTQSLANRAPQMPGYTPVGKQWSDFQDYLTKTGQKDAYDQANQKLKEAKQALSTVDPNHRNTPEALELVAKYQQAGKELNDIFSTWAGAKGAVSIGNESVGMTRQLTGLAAGTKDTDAVNVAQLKALANAPMGFDIGGKLENNVYTPGAKNWTMPLNGLRMSFGDGLLAEEVTDKDGKKYTLVKMNDEITLGKDGKDGKIGINGKDGKSAEITVGKGEPGVDGTNGKDGITRIIYKDEKGNHHEVATLDDGLKFKGDNADVVIRKLNTQLNITGGAKADELSDDNIGVVGTAGDNGGLAVKLSKKLKGLTSAEFKDGDNITNITAGDISITKKEGDKTKTLNIWELNNTVNDIKQGKTDVSSWKLQANGKNERIIKKDGIVNFKNGANTEVTVNGNDITVDLNKTTKDQIQSNTTKINNIDKRVTTIENNIDQKIEGSKIKVEGDKATGVNATEVKDGDKVTGYKVSLEKKVQVGNVAIDGTDKKGEITGLTNTTVDAADFATKGRAATEEQLKAAMDKAVAQGTTTVKAGDKNISVVKTENKNEYTVKLAKDITVDSVTAKTVKADEYKVGDKIYINKDGINANGNKITNVGDGKISKDSTDAVNGKQLYGVEQKVNQNTTNINKLQNNIYDMGMKVGELDTRVNKVGAGAAALAALHPQDFDPEDKWDIAAGVGNYKNATAAAVGLFYRPNERTMLNLGWTMGDSRNMVNAGVSVKLGSGSTYAGLSKVQMATRLTQQEEKITAQEQEIKELREREEQREKQIQEILSKLEMIEKAKA